MSLFSEFIQSIATVESAAVVGLIGLSYLGQKRGLIRGLSAIGPYDSVTTGVLERVLTRGLTQGTCVDLEVPWYPLSDFSDQIPARTVDNGHAVAGSHRDQARKQIFSAVANLGLSPVELSPAKQTRGLCSSAWVQHYAPNDLTTPIQDPLYLDGSTVVVCIDTDYYLRDPGYLLGHARPLILYTFNPTRVSGLDGDCRYRIRDDEVVYEVDGGGLWKHRVWDWCGVGEFIVNPAFAKTWLGSLGHWLAGLVGLQKVVVHKVHQARPWPALPNRALVWCIPQVSYWRWQFLRSDLHCRQLKRVVYADVDRPGWNKLIVHDSKASGVLVNIGRAGDDLSVSLAKQDFDLVMGCASAQAVSSRLISLGIKDPRLIALVGQYYSASKTQQRNDASYLPRPALAPAVHWIPNSHADLPDVRARNYAKPLVSKPALAPMIRRWETLAHSLEVRVVRVANSTKPPIKYLEFAREFIELLVPVPHVGRPYSLEDTAVELDKPKQRADFERVLETLDVEPKALIEAFVKNESTMKTPRVISAWADFRWILTCSSFQFAFKNNILLRDENSHWFYPGRTPTEIAKGLQEFHVAAVTVAESDYSNMDGMTSEALQRSVAFAAELRYFEPQYHEALRKVHNNLLFAPARSKTFGYKYEAGVGVKSGSPTTTNHNTIHSAFHEYCAIRMVYPDLSPADAWLMLGPKCGDDGVTRASLANKLQKVVSDYGMIMKVEKCKPETGVTFLARVFPDPVNTLTSFQDPLRTWRKLHMSFRDGNVPLADAACDRVDGYLATDRLTPVTGDFCAMVRRFYESEASSELDRKRRKDRCREVPYWVSSSETWQQHPNDRQLMLNCISARVGLDVAVLERFCAQMASPGTTPFHFTPLVPDELSPYDETLDDECQPDVKWVDNRNNNNNHVRKAIDAAAVGRIPSEARGVGAADHGTTQASREPSESGKRHRGPRRVSQENGDTREQRRRKPEEQTDLSPGGPGRGHTGDGEDRPRRGGPPSSPQGSGGRHRRPSKEPRRRSQTLASRDDSETTSPNTRKSRNRNSPRQE